MLDEQGSIIISYLYKIGHDPLCVPKDVELITSNQFIEVLSVKMMNVSLEKCLGEGCAPLEEIEAFVDTILLSSFVFQD